MIATRLLTLVTLAATLGSPAVAATRPDLAQRLDEKVRSHSEFFGTVLVAIGKDVILDKAYGRDASGQPIEPGTRFWIASISKQFTAAAILKLRDQGKLSLDDSVSRFFDDLPSDKSSITIRQLLMHESGIGQNYAADGIVDRDSAVEAILKEPLQRPPGKGFGYANDNYNLLAAIVEVASGRSFETYVRKELFEPAGMRETSFWGESPSVAAIARSLSPDVTRPNWGYRGATGIASTTGDLLRWVRALRAGSVLSRESVEQLLSMPVDIGKGRREGYGWFSSIDEAGRKTLWTRGYEDIGHGGYVAVAPDWGWTVIVLSSSGAGGGRDGYPLTHVIAPELVSIVRDGRR